MKRQIHFNAVGLIFLPFALFAFIGFLIASAIGAFTPKDISHS